MRPDFRYCKYRGTSLQFKSDISSCKLEFCSHNYANNPHTHSHGTNDLQTKILAKIGHNVKSTLNHCSGKNEVIQKETKALIRISNLLSKWGFPPSAKGLQKGQRRGEKAKQWNTERVSLALWKVIMHNCACFENAAWKSDMEKKNNY